MKRYVSMLLCLLMALSMLAMPASAEEQVTLKIVGPGLFTTVGETGTEDLVTGIKRPGYEVIVARWNELHPNVKLEIETVPWDNWKAVLQTAALAEDVDVLVHGASITAISVPVGDLLAKEEGLEEKFSMLPMRRVEGEGNDFAEYIPYGLTITANPLAMVVDKKIFEDYGAAVPGLDWTLEDLYEAAKATTGTDPVTGEETYGISMIAAASANKNYIWVSRAMDATVFNFGKTLKETTGNINNDKSKAVFDYINSLYPFSSPDYLEGLDMGASGTASSNLAMYITEDVNGAYTKINAAGLADRFMFLPLPTILEGDNAGITSSHMGDWNMSICNTSKQQEWAWEFIKFMATDPVVLEWLVDCNSLPSNLDGLEYLKEAMAPDYYNAIDTILSQQPRAFSASTNVCYDSANFGTFANDITTVINEMFVGNMDSSQAVELIQKNLDLYMAGLK